MALIGKDGKDGSSLTVGARSIGLPDLGLRVNSRLSYFKIEYAGVGKSGFGELLETGRILESSKSGGVVDAYGSSGDGKFFVILGAASEKEAMGYAEMLPLSRSADGAPKISSIDA